MFRIRCNLDPSSVEYSGSFPVQKGVYKVKLLSVTDNSDNIYGSVVFLDIMKPQRYGFNIFLEVFYFHLVSISGTRSLEVTLWQKILKFVFDNNTI